MSKAYNELMNKIEVDAEMRERVLKNVEAAAEKRRNRLISFKTASKYASLAAALALIILGALTFSKDGRTDVKSAPSDSAVSDGNSGYVTAAGGIEDCAALAELSEKTGIGLDTLEKLPYAENAAAYTSFWGEMAQISTYADDGTALLYRVSFGSGDNSGDYNEYGETVFAETNGVTVTLKGSGGEYSLAVWNNGSLAFSLSADPSMSEDAMIEIVSAALSG